jgi:hypothetical protein
MHAKTNLMQAIQIFPVVGAYCMTPILDIIRLFPCLFGGV